VGWEYLLKSFPLNTTVMMNNRLRLIAIVLALSLAFCLVSSVATGLAFSTESQGGRIDIFTQKEPFSGRGLNVSSDAFSPEEEVIIYASVTYNNYPVEQAQVAFEIHGPENPTSNITLFGYAQTNEGGFGSFSFRIGLETEMNFGQWNIVGTTLLAGEVIQDHLYFRVGWIVEIVSVRTVDENQADQTRFPKGSYVGVELSIRNIAMVSKQATITMTTYDFLKVPVNSTEIENYQIPANESAISIYRFMKIPDWATAGEAMVSACLYTAPVSSGGVPYGPEVSRHFFIIRRDIGILNITVSSLTAYKGDDLSIDVTVKNYGEESESFDTYAYYNEENVIGEKYFQNLEPDANVTLSFVWNTSSINEGFYQISAYSALPNDDNISDNMFVDGIVQIESLPPLKYYLTVTTDPSGVALIFGEGWYDEGTNVTLLAPSYVSVSSGSRYGFIDWDVDGAEQLGNETTVTMNANHTAIARYVLQYYLTVETDPPEIATILGEGWYDDSTAVTLNAPAIARYHFENWSLDGINQGSQVNPITVNMNSTHTAVAHYSAITGWFPIEWLYWFMFALLILIIILLAIWVYRRRRKKIEEAFYSGWTAWYYACDLRKRLPSVRMFSSLT
jgi:hypothetical protein